MAFYAHEEEEGEFEFAGDMVERMFTMLQGEDKELSVKVLKPLRIFVKRMPEKHKEILKGAMKDRVFEYVLDSTEPAHIPSQVVTDLMDAIDEHLNETDDLNRRYSLDHLQRCMSELRALGLP